MTGCFGRWFTTAGSWAPTVKSTGGWLLVSTVSPEADRAARLVGPARRGALRRRQGQNAGRAGLCIPTERASGKKCLATGSFPANRASSETEARMISGNGS